MPKDIVAMRFKTALWMAVGRLTRLTGRVLQKPLFVVGTGRCGSTLLIKVLRSHPQIFVFPGEANRLWHPALYPYTKSRIKAPPILQDVRKFSRVSVLHWPRNNPDLIRDVFTGSFLLNRAAVFCNKSAMLSCMIPRLLEVFPGAFFLHMYRNGPSVVESLVEKEYPKYSEWFTDQWDFRVNCARYWRDSVSCIREADRYFGLRPKGRILEVSYEEFCRDPERTIETISDYLGIDSRDYLFDCSSVRASHDYRDMYLNNPEYSTLVGIMQRTMDEMGYALTEKRGGGGFKGRS